MTIHFPWKFGGAPSNKVYDGDGNVACECWPYGDGGQAVAKRIVAAINNSQTDAAEIQRLRDCLGSIRAHLVGQESALAVAIRATCDSGLRNSSD